MFKLLKAIMLLIPSQSSRYITSERRRYNVVLLFDVVTTSK